MAQRLPRVTPLNARIRALREEHGLDHRQFAEQLGLTRPTIARYEQGAVGVPKYVIVAMEHVFRVNGRWLLFGEAPKYLGVQKPVPHADLIGVVKQHGVIYAFLEKLLKVPTTIPGVKRA